MSDPAVNRLVLITGMAQTGKSTKALQLVRQTNPRVFILDPIRSQCFTDAPDVITLTTWREVAEFLTSDRSRGHWLIALRAEDSEEYLGALACFRYLRHTTVLVDEALIFLTDAEAKYFLVRAARTNAHYGGGLGVPLWFTAQRPMDIPTDIRSQVTRVVSFRQEEPRDLDFLRTRCNPEFGDRVAKLNKVMFEFADWPNGSAADVPAEEG